MDKKKKTESQPKPDMEKIQKRIDLEEELEKGFPQWFWPGLACIVLGFVLFLTILITGELTVQRRMASRPSQMAPAPSSSVIPVDTLTYQLEQQSSSDELRAIEADLEKTNLTEIDKELEEIEAELLTP